LNHPRYRRILLNPRYPKVEGKLKVGFNGFSGTQLDQVLRDRGIKRVLLAGMVTSLCIDSTGRAAYERGYSVTVLSDCTSSRTTTEQEFFCSTVFPLYGEVMSGKEVLAGGQMTVAV
jgi:nicotinamidase-related amidase